MENMENNKKEQGYSPNLKSNNLNLYKSTPNLTYQNQEDLLKTRYPKTITQNVKNKLGSITQLSQKNLTESIIVNHENMQIKKSLPFQQEKEVKVKNKVWTILEYSTYGAIFSGTVFGIISIVNQQGQEEKIYYTQKTNRKNQKSIPLDKIPEYLDDVKFYDQNKKPIYKFNLNDEEINLENLKTEDDLTKKFKYNDQDRELFIIDYDNNIYKKQLAKNPQDDIQTISNIDELSRKLEATKKETNNLTDDTTKEIDNIITSQKNNNEFIYKNLPKNYLSPIYNPNNATGTLQQTYKIEETDKNLTNTQNQNNQSNSSENNQEYKINLLEVSKFPQISPNENSNTEIDPNKLTAPKNPYEKN